MPEAGESVELGGLRLFPVTAALIASAPGFYAANPTDARAAMAMVRDASELLRRLLGGGHSTIAGCLAGAMRNIGRDRIADDILQTMRAAGYDVREQDPFSVRMAGILPPGPAAPHVTRLRLMWQQMRGVVCDRFPPAPGVPSEPDDYLRRVEEGYVTDAYHSLSIEGYQVSPELIERVRGGAWNPDAHEADRDQRNALVARGYWQAHQAVQASVGRVLQGENPGIVADEDHGAWYREMFAPSVVAGLLRPADLAGYRGCQVYIRGSMQVPPRCEAVRDLMPRYSSCCGRKRKQSFVPRSAISCSSTLTWTAMAVSAAF